MSSQQDPIRVMVVDDHPMWRDAVARDLAEAGLDVVATAGDGEQAVRRAKATTPDVLVLDLNLPAKPGVQVCKEVVAANPALRVLVLSASGEHADVLEAVKSGATGYLLKSASTEELLDAVRRTAVGDPVFTPGLAGLVLGEYHAAGLGPRPRRGRRRRTERAPADRPGDRGAAAGGQGPELQADRRTPRHLAPNGPEPRPEHPRQAPAPQPGGTGPVRDRARPRRRVTTAARGGGQFPGDSPELNLPSHICVTWITITVTFVGQPRRRDTSMRVGVLTGGGDCPGLNAVIRAVVRKGVQEYGHEFVGFRDGWRGPLEGRSIRLDIPAVRGILPRGGTILGSSRTNPLKEEDGIRRIKDTLARQRVGALITIGGEDTLGVAARLSDEYGVPCVGVPKTIDNDLSATDYTFGFDTAVGIATEAIDRLHTTAESHMRVLVVEVMGRRMAGSPCTPAWSAAPTSSSSPSSASTSSRSAPGLPPASGRRTPRSWSSPRARCPGTATRC